MTIERIVKEYYPFNDFEVTVTETVTVEFFRVNSDYGYTLSGGEYAINTNQPENFDTSIFCNLCGNLNCMDECKRYEPSGEIQNFLDIQLRQSFFQGLKMVHEYNENDDLNKFFEVETIKIK